MKFNSKLSLSLIIIKLLFHSKQEIKHQKINNQQIIKTFINSILQMKKKFFINNKNITRTN